MLIHATVCRAIPSDRDLIDLDDAAEVVTVYMDFPDGDGPGGFRAAVVTSGFDADGGWSSEFISRVMDTDGTVAGFIHASSRVLPESAQFTPFPDNPSVWTWTRQPPPGFPLATVLLHEAYSAVVDAELSESAEGSSFRPHLHAPENMNLRDLTALMELGPSGSSSRVHVLDL